MTDTSTRDPQQPGGLTGWIRAPQPPPPWALGDALITLVVLAIAMIVVASSVALLLAGPGVTVPTGRPLLAGWLIGLLLVIAFVLVRHRRSPEQFAALRLGASRLPLPLVLLMGIGAAVTIDLVAAAAGGGFQPVATLAGFTAAGPADWILAAALLALVQPIAEGLVFQGVLLPRLRASIGPVIGWLATALIFGLYHLLIFGAALGGAQAIAHGLIAPLLLGLFLTWVRLRTGSTTAAILAHAGYGLTSVLIALALVS